MDSLVGAFVSLVALMVSILLTVVVVAGFLAFWALMGIIYILGTPYRKRKAENSNPSRVSDRQP